MKKVESYNTNIITWERSSYNGVVEYPGFIEKIATKLRSSIRTRQNIALDLIKYTLKDKTVFDLGCGSGFFSSKLVSCGVKKVVGIDFSAEAIKCATQKVLAYNQRQRYEFICGDIRDIKFPYFDIVVGLGLLDWLSLKEIENLFSKLRKKKILFTFSEWRISPYNFFHWIYSLYRSLMTKTNYRINYYHLSTILNILRRYGFEDIKVVRDKRMYFGTIVHNFDISGNK